MEANALTRFSGNQLSHEIESFDLREVVRVELRHPVTTALSLKMITVGVTGPGPG